MVCRVKEPFLTLLFVRCYDEGMVKRLSASVILLTLALLIAHPYVHATSQQAYQDYLYQYDLFRQTYTTFTTAKTEYQKFGSLQAQATAVDKTKAMLTQRNQLLNSYLFVLNEKLNEDRGLRVPDKQRYQGTLATEKSFLDTNNARIPTIGTLDDAEAISKLLATHYPTLQTGIRQVLIGISLGQLAALHLQYDATLTQIRDLIGANASQFDTQKQAVLNRWLLQIDTKRSLYQQKIDNVIAVSNDLKIEDDRELDQKFDDMVKNLADGRQLLSEGSGFMGEVLTAIKYKQ
jgi:hypothetical protein